MSVSMLVDGEWRTLSGDEHKTMLLAEMRSDGLDPCERCFNVKVDGVCGWCRMDALLNADPDFSAMADAQARIDFQERGPAYTFEDLQADEATVAAFERKVATAERDAATEPGACADCHRHESVHRWFHKFVPPSDRLRLARMYARRAKRLGLPVWSRPGRGAA